MGYITITQSSGLSWGDLMIAIDGMIKTLMQIPK